MLEKEVRSPMSSNSIWTPNSSSIRFSRVIAATESQVSTESCDAVLILFGGKSGNTVAKTFSKRCSNLSIDLFDFVMQTWTLRLKRVPRQSDFRCQRPVRHAAQEVMHRSILWRTLKFEDDLVDGKSAK